MSSKKALFSSLYVMLKAELKARGLTYRDVAAAFGVSANSIRHRFSLQTLTIEQLIALSELLGISMSDMFRKIEMPSITRLSLGQEEALMQDLRLALVLVLILDDYSIEDIVAAYDMTEAQCIKYLLELDRLELIDLLPGNVVRKHFDRNVEWLPGGPIHRFVASHAAEFLDSSFDSPFESRFVTRASLTPFAVALLQSELRQLRQRIDDLHEECKIAPVEQRHKIVVLSAAREWALPEFEAMRRKPGKPPQDTE